MTMMFCVSVEIRRNTWLWFSGKIWTVTKHKTKITTAYCLTMFHAAAVWRVGPCGCGEPSGRFTVRLASIHTLPGAEPNPGAGARADVWWRVGEILGFGGRYGEAHGRCRGLPRRRLLGFRQREGFEDPEAMTCSQSAEDAWRRGCGPAHRHGDVRVKLERVEMNL